MTVAENKKVEDIWGDWGIKNHRSAAVRGGAPPPPEPLLHVLMYILYYRGSYNLLCIIHISTVLQVNTIFCLNKKSRQNDIIARSRLKEPATHSLEMTIKHIHRISICQCKTSHAHQIIAELHLVSN